MDIEIKIGEYFPNEGWLQIHILDEDFKINRTLQLNQKQIEAMAEHLKKEMCHPTHQGSVLTLKFETPAWWLMQSLRNRERCQEVACIYYAPLAETCNSPEKPIIEPYLVRFMGRCHRWKKYRDTEASKEEEFTPNLSGKITCPSCHSKELRHRNDVDGIITMKSHNFNDSVRAQEVTVYECPGCDLLVAMSD